MANACFRILSPVILFLLISLSSIYSGDGRTHNAMSTQQQQLLSPTKVVERYYDLSLKGKFDEANKFITNTNGIVSAPGVYDTESSKIIFDGKIEIKQILCESIKGKNATVTVQVSDRIGHIYKIEYLFYKDKEGWKIWSSGIEGKNVKPCS